jgi:hypothetical protein
MTAIETIGSLHRSVVSVLDHRPSLLVLPASFLTGAAIGIVARIWMRFITSDPDMLEHQTFNRVMFAIMLPICIWMVPRGIREFRADQAAAAKKHSGSSAH